MPSERSKSFPGLSEEDWGNISAPVKRSECATFRKYHFDQSKTEDVSQGNDHWDFYLRANDNAIDRFRNAYITAMSKQLIDEVLKTIPNCTCTVTTLNSFYYSSVNRGSGR